MRGLFAYVAVAAVCLCSVNSLRHVSIGSKLLKKKSINIHAVFTEQFSMDGCIMDSRTLEVKGGNKVKNIGMPRLVAPSLAVPEKSNSPEEPWMMWFHYRDDSIPSNVMNISTGKIALATSRDGISGWQLHEDSPVFNPSKLNGDW